MFRFLFWKSETSLLCREKPECILIIKLRIFDIALENWWRNHLSSFSVPDERSQMSPRQTLKYASFSQGFKVCKFNIWWLTTTETFWPRGKSSHSSWFFLFRIILTRLAVEGRKEQVTISFCSLHHCYIWSQTNVRSIQASKDRPWREWSTEILILCLTEVLVKRQLYKSWSLWGQAKGPLSKWDVTIVRLLVW